MEKSNKIVISIDAMGGDNGASITLEGAAQALHLHPDLYFLIHGVEDEVMPILKRYPNLLKSCKFYPASVVITMDEKPSQAVRRGRKDSSMVNAINSVKNGEAGACISAGNTGALMALAKLSLKMLDSIDRPGIAGIWPTLKNYTIVLDIGATIGATAQHLVDLSIMGASMSRALYGYARPRIGLLNIGVEEVKGLDEIKHAALLLKNMDSANIEYAGFIEGNAIGLGKVDIVVTEGFVGNIALKTAEGTAKQVSQILSEELRKSFFGKVGYLFARKCLARAKQRLNPDRANGGLLLGLNGLVVKSHGGASAAAFCSAILNTRTMIMADLLNKIKNDLDDTHQQQYENLELYQLYKD